jgi:hypothetical protein
MFGISGGARHARIATRCPAFSSFALHPQCTLPSCLQKIPQPTMLIVALMRLRNIVSFLPPAAVSFSLVAGHDTAIALRMKGIALWHAPCRIPSHSHSRRLTEVNEQWTCKVR